MAGALPLALDTGPDDAAATAPAVGRLRAVLPADFRGRVQSARELARARREEAAEHPPLPTAVPALDRLLAGGLPRAHLVELVGARSSGRFSTVLAALAATTGVGEAAALVDLGDGLDPAAALAAGVDLARLLWLRPADLQGALASAEIALGAGFPLVALDLGPPPVRGGRGIEAAWLRLARSARAHGAALLVASPYRVSGTAATAVLRADRARAVWQGGGATPWLLGGAATRLTIEKHRGTLPGQSAGLELKTAECPPGTRIQTPAAPAAAAPRPRPAVWEELPEPRRAAGGRR